MEQKIGRIQSDFGF